MFHRRSHPQQVTTEVQERILRILAQKLADSNGRFDAEAMWAISRVAHEFNALDHLLELTAESVDIESEAICTTSP
jgi:hypothetical protein